MSMCLTYSEFNLIERWLQDKWKLFFSLKIEKSNKIWIEYKSKNIYRQVHVIYIWS